MTRVLILAATFAALLTAGCSSSYHLAYAVVNETDDTLYVVDRKKVIAVLPDSSAEIYSESGIGKAKSGYNETKATVTAGLRYYNDSTLCDSCRVKPAGEWKYYALPMGYYNARLYIREKDIR
jgi:hypothetical protein